MRRDRQRRAEFGLAKYSSKTMLSPDLSVKLSKWFNVRLTDCFTMASCRKRWLQIKSPQPVTCWSTTTPTIPRTRLPESEVAAAPTSILLAIQPGRHGCSSSPKKSARPSPRFNRLMLKHCPCHEDCLKPGNPRRTDCKGEDRSGCANCTCFGLVHSPEWAVLCRERGIKKP